jgi:hypothetical protein
MRPFTSLIKHDLLEIAGADAIAAPAQVIICVGVSGEAAVPTDMIPVLKSHGEIPTDARIRIIPTTRLRTLFAAARSRAP